MNPAEKDILTTRAYRFSLKCMTCGDESDAPSVASIYCHCGGIYEMIYRSRRHAMYSMPLSDTTNIIQLGQGNTPVLDLQRTARYLGIEKLFAKLEFCSPTGSFKDRGSAILLSAAIEEGVTEFVEDSSGNAGASMAAYAAAAGIKAHIFAPLNAAKGKLDQIRIFGAELHLIEGPRQAATDAARSFAQHENILHLSHALSPWFAEGIKSIAHELQTVEATQNITDIVAPAGNGALLIGINAAYEPTNKPRIHCIQSESVQPIVAGANGTVWDSSDAKPTIASGISVADPPRVAQAVAAVKDSRGHAIAVPEEDILRWRERLASEEGIFCEPTSATTFAGLEALVSAGKIKQTAKVAIPITGSGLKEPV